MYPYGLLCWLHIYYIPSTAWNNYKCCVISALRISTSSNVRGLFKSKSRKVDVLGVNIYPIRILQKEYEQIMFSVAWNIYKYCVISTSKTIDSIKREGSIQKPIEKHAMCLEPIFSPSKCSNIIDHILCERSVQTCAEHEWMCSKPRSFPSKVLKNERDQIMFSVSLSALESSISPLYLSKRH